MRKIAISDIHGCCQTFKQLLENIQLQKEDELYLLGDYIDRGPESKQVIDHIWSLQRRGYQVHCLRGNHEQLMLNARADYRKSRIWLINGGETTMDSFRATSLEEIDDRYWQFMENLPYYFEVDNYILVHAGLNFMIEDPFEGKEGMIWIRNWYGNINKAWLGDKIIVHGHTVTESLKVANAIQNFDNIPVIDIDAGCYVTALPQYGHLCAFDLTSQEIHLQKNIDKMDVRFTM